MDYKSQTTKIGAGFIGVLGLMLVIIFDIHHTPLQPVTQELAIQPVTSEQLNAPATTPGRMHQVTIKKGDTLAAIFDHLHLSANTLEQVTASSIAEAQLAQIKPNQKITFYISKPHQLQQIIYPYNHDSTLYVTQTLHGYRSEIKSKPVAVVLTYKKGVVRGSLEHAALRAGLNLPLYRQLRTIFQGDINFQRDIRRGDHFAILYQEYYINGHKDHAGNIMMASFTNKGKTYQAFRYTYPKNHTGYYKLDGTGVAPLFLQAPLHYKRISGYFTYHRMDPYLHVMRPHLGIDYAAPFGTPIHSIGNGHVIFKGRDHGYGNAVVVRYSHKYKALYGHMSRFAKSLHTGQDVKQGQIIGYVGSTGWATGPHLHFEMYVYGIPKNPLKMKFPGGQSIPASYSKRYQQYAHSMLERFNLYQSSGFAENGTAQLNE